MTRTDVLNIRLKCKKEIYSFKVKPCLGPGFLKQRFRVYLKMSNEALLDRSQYWRNCTSVLGLKHLDSNSLGGV